MASFLQEPIRRDLGVWKLTGEPPKLEEELGSGAMGIVYKGEESLFLAHSFQPLSTINQSQSKSC